MRAIRFIRRGGGAGLVAVLGLAFGVFGLNPGALWRDDVPGAPEAPPPDRPAVATAPTVAAPPPPLPTLAAAPAASPVPAPSPAPAAPDPESEAAEALALSGEARVVGMRHLDDRTRLALSLPGAGPWRVFALNDPPRLIVDVAAGGWAGPRPAPPPDGLIAGLRAGMAEAGRARLALDLARPASLAEALMTPLPGGGARLRVILAPASSDEFAAASARGWPPGARASGGRSGFAADLRDAPDPRTPDRPLVMVDAGHGGFDPGAIRGEAVEKAIALDFARDLARALEDTGRWRAELTRDDDRYLGLDERVALAEAAGASVFLSIHANTVARGEALGASVFSLALRASDDETGALASSENRADIRAGAGHEEDGGPARGAGQGAGPGPDDIEAIVEAIGRGPATLASRSLADALAEDLGAVTPMLRGRAHAQARFRVLRSTRMASALVELGFLSAPEDLARMRDPGWRRLASQALAAGLDDWRAGAAARAYASAPGGRVAAAAD